MYSITLLFIIVVILATLFLVLNFILAPHNPYQEKYSIFECGFHSFLGQNRAQFGIRFFAFCFTYLVFDLEIVLLYPSATSLYANEQLGLWVMVVFAGIIAVGFCFEIGKNALSIDSRQSYHIFFDKLSSQSPSTVSTLNTNLQILLHQREALQFKKNLSISKFIDRNRKFSTIQATVKRRVSFLTCSRLEMNKNVLHFLHNPRTSSPSQLSVSLIQKRYFSSPKTLICS